MRQWVGLAEDFAPLAARPLVAATATSANVAFPANSVKKKTCLVLEVYELSGIIKMQVQI